MRRNLARHTTALPKVIVERKYCVPGIAKRRLEGHEATSMGQRETMRHDDARQRATGGLRRVESSPTLRSTAEELNGVFAHRKFARLTHDLIYVRRAANAARYT